MKPYQHDLRLLKHIWDNRNADINELPHLFYVSIEPQKKWNRHRYTVWIYLNNDLVNISETIYQAIKQSGLRDEIKLWVDRDYYCRPTKVETTGFANYMLAQFFDCVGFILAEAGMIADADELQPGYTFVAANYFKRIL